MGLSRCLSLSNQVPMLSLFPTKANPPSRWLKPKTPYLLSLPPSHLSLNHSLCFLRTYKAPTVRTLISLYGKALVTYLPTLLNHKSFQSSGLAGTPAPASMAWGRFSTSESSMTWKWHLLESHHHDPGESLTQQGLE